MPRPRHRTRQWQNKRPCNTAIVSKNHNLNVLGITNVRSQNLIVNRCWLLNAKTTSTSTAVIGSASADSPRHICHQPSAALRRPSVPDLHTIFRSRLSTSSPQRTPSSQAVERHYCRRDVDHTVSHPLPPRPAPAPAHQVIHISLLEDGLSCRGQVHSSHD
jgi:hypothetical protein